jgi:hypothetical protein
VEYLPTPELGLFAAELLIGIICVGIFTNARVGIIHGVIGIIYDGIFTDARVGNIRDQIFIDARVRNIVIKPSFYFLKKNIKNKKYTCIDLNLFRRFIH